MRRKRKLNFRLGINNLGVVFNAKDLICSLYMPGLSVTPPPMQQ
jgi:hypothetical protein